MALVDCASESLSSGVRYSAPSLGSYRKGISFCSVGRLFGTSSSMPSLLTPELGPFSMVSILRFSKVALGESVLGVINRLGVSLWSSFAFRKLHCYFVTV